MTIEVALMIEGQDGLTWPRWQRIARAAEELGFVGLYRSDHFTNPDAPDKESLELWMSLNWLASHTQRIEFGPLVSPVSFRHPALTARMAAAVDDLSGGRLQLGLGAGWQEREHHLWGFDLLDTTPRFERFQEGLEVITRLLRSDEPVAFDGQYYQVRGATLLPRPERTGGPPIVIGGNGPRLTLPLVARYADEWNGVFITGARFAALSAQLDELLAQAGRAPQSVRRTLMTRVVIGRTPEEVAGRLGGQGADELRGKGLVVGTPAELRIQLADLASHGVQRVMLQWLDLDDIGGIETLAHVL
jgi:F420-dependent oxidoreductase-like protein